MTFFKASRERESVYHNAKIKDDLENQKNCNKYRNKQLVSKNTTESSNFELK